MISYWDGVAEKIGFKPGVKEWGSNGSWMARVVIGESFVLVIKSILSAALASVVLLLLLLLLLWDYGVASGSARRSC